MIIICLLRRCAQSIFAWFVPGTSPTFECRWNNAVEREMQQMREQTKREVIISDAFASTTGKIAPERFQSFRCQFFGVGHN